MISNIYRLVLILIGCSVFLTNATAQKQNPSAQWLGQAYDLVPVQLKDTQYFEMESRLQNYDLDGTPKGWDAYHLFLRCIPSSDPSKGDEYTCLRFTVQLNKGPERSIPSLSGWKYYFSLTANAMDQKGQVFGIDHGKFETIIDEQGNTVPVGNTYHVYNAFIDFHSMNVFSEKSHAGGGAQHLKHLGDRIVHVASFSQPPVNLGSNVKEGSYFKNGEVTLQFKGISLVNEKTCAILEYDSGQSSFFMKLTPMPNTVVTTKGSSHYFGDIYKDLNGGWIQKATLHEMVVSETNVPGMNKINMVVERTIQIKNISSSPAFK